MEKRNEFVCAVFDGEKVFESAKVTVENGVIKEVLPCEEEKKADHFLMPGLIDGHLHIKKEKQIEQIKNCGITAVCDVCIPKEIKETAGNLRIHTSYFMAAGNVENGREFVEKAIRYGADYIKVILEQPPMMAPKTMPESVLKEICTCAHEHGLKVAVHAVDLTMTERAVDSGADIVLHVPLKEEFPPELARKIAQKNIAVVPTLGMMKAFSKTLFFGYKRSDYKNAENAVRVMKSEGVRILLGTDSNSAPFIPNIKHGTSVFDEMELLEKAGLSPIEILRAATLETAEAFGLENTGRIAPGYRADMILIKGRPDKNISDIRKTEKVFFGGKIIK